MILEGAKTSLTTIGSYHVTVQVQSVEKHFALLSPAVADDMLANWTFNWPTLWQNTDFECQGITKLMYAERVWGLVRYGLYPYPGSPSYLEIEQLEANPISRGETAQRLIEPIGKWLIWYSTKVGLQYCPTEADEPLIVLAAIESAVSYYRDKVQMEYLGPITIAPGEDGYAFRFSRTAAAGFCQRHESQWGVPKLFNQ